MDAAFPQSLLDIPGISTCTFFGPLKYKPDSAIVKIVTTQKNPPFTLTMANACRCFLHEKAICKVLETMKKKWRHGRENSSAVKLSLKYNVSEIPIQQ